MAGSPPVATPRRAGLEVITSVKLNSAMEEIKKLEKENQELKESLASNEELSIARSENETLRRQLQQQHEYCAKTNKEKEDLKKLASEAINQFFAARVAVLGFKCQALLLQGEVASLRKPGGALKTCNSDFETERKLREDIIKIKLHAEQKIQQQACDIASLQSQLNSLTQQLIQQRLRGDENQLDDPPGELYQAPSAVGGHRQISRERELLSSQWRSGDQGTPPFHFQAQPQPQAVNMVPTSVMQPISTGVATGTVQPISTGVATGTVQPISTGVATGTVQPISTGVATGTVQPISTGVATGTVQPISTGVATGTMQPISTGVATGTVQPISTGVATGSIQPISTGVATGTIQPISTVVTPPKVATGVRTQTGTL